MAAPRGGAPAQGEACQHCRSHCPERCAAVAGRAGCRSGAGVLLAAFVAVELLVRDPMLSLGMFRSPTFTSAQLAAFGISASFFALYLYILTSPTKACRV